MTSYGTRLVDVSTAKVPRGHVSSSEAAERKGHGKPYRAALFRNSACHNSSERWTTISAHGSRVEADDSAFMR
jgi:hypothetical protein